MTSQQEARRASYEQQRKELEKKCITCKPSSWEQCSYGCSVGRSLQLLQVRFSDVTGWGHNEKTGWRAS